MALLKLKTELENALARASKTSTKLHAPQESPAIFFKILVEDEEIEEWWRFMTLDCVVVGFCLWKERWLRSCRTSQQTCHNIPSYCNTHVFRRDIITYVRLQRAHASGICCKSAKQRNPSFEMRSFCFLYIRFNEQRKNDEKRKPQNTYRVQKNVLSCSCDTTMCNTPYKYLQHLTTVYNILQLFSCFSFVAWISLLQGELSLHEDWFWSLEVLQQPPIHTK